MSRRGAARLVLFLAFAVTVSAVFVSGWSDGQVERGRYLVEQVGMCGDCHTPRDNQGEPDRSRWLQGASIWFQPIQPVPDWAYAAPPIAGLGSFTREQTLQVLEKGMGPQGLLVRRPMHRFHMVKEDAEAIVAYLLSLKSSGR
jgi:mono/diheme cytochrome c family protein